MLVDVVLASPLKPTEGVEGVKMRKRRGDEGEQKKRPHPGGSPSLPPRDRAFMATNGAFALTSVLVDAASMEKV